MKHSIKKQMIVVFVGLTLCLILTLFVINIRFLEPYYIHNKEAEFINLYEELEKAVDSDSLMDEDVFDHLRNIAEKSNISFLVSDNENQRVVTNVHDMDNLKQQLMGYLLNQAQKQSEVLETSDTYQIGQSMDPMNQSEYIEMWGEFENGNKFLMRSPLESIKESAAISNRFLIQIGLTVLVICIFFVWFFSKKLTEPILELAALSNRMADLDFEAKYTSGGNNEIGMLGDNFNRMSARLEQTISELKSANNSLQKDIERKDKLESMRNEFLGNVSHELKTPIALIQGYAEGLKEDVNTDQESRDFYCDVIMDEAQKMNRMVQNLLALNQLEFGDEEIEFERFDLAEVIQGVLQNMEIISQQKDVNVIFRQKEPVYVWADEFKVEQVVRNYISNAFNHVSGDNVIEIKITKEGGKARTSVFNTGTPIPEEDIPHIWEKFYKVDKAHTREYGGNGIGLSIVKAIMESFRQKYGVTNYDNGVEFWMELDIQ